MKTILLLFAALATGVVSAQCISAESVSWGEDQFTITLSINGDHENVLMPDGTVAQPDALNKIQFTAPMDRSNDTFVWFIYNDGQGNCPFFFQADIETIVHDQHIEVTPPSACEVADAAVCIENDTYNLEFSVDGIASVDGCVEGVTAGSYTIGFDYIVGNDGVRYTNPDKQKSVFDIGVRLMNEAGVLTPQISGGSGDYSYFINGGSLNTPVANFVARCYTVEVTDNLTGCKTTITEYASQSIAGDIASSNLSDTPDGCISTGDLLKMIGSLGTPTKSTDFNCNGITAIEDLLFFLTRFGTSPC